MSLQGIFDPMVRAYFAGQNSNSGDSGNQRVLFFDYANVDKDTAPSVSFGDVTAYKVSDQSFTEAVIGGHLFFRYTNNSADALPITSDSCQFDSEVGLIVVVFSYTNAGDPDGCVSYLNQNAAEMFGTEPGAYVAYSEGRTTLAEIGIIYPA